MPNAFIEPLPKGDAPEAPTSYQIEFSDGSKHVGPFDTQKQAIDAATQLGHKPLVARVRKTDQGQPDHWRAA